MRMSKKFNKVVRESVLFRRTGLANNTLVRKSLALPAVEELSHLFDEDDKVEKAERESLLKKNGTHYT
jgi:hypothetical protein